jgi:hypothetical protein
LDTLSNLRALPYLPWRIKVPLNCMTCRGIVVPIIFQVLCFTSLDGHLMHLWGGGPPLASIYLEADVKTSNFEGMCFFLGLVWPVLVNAGSYDQGCHAEVKYVSQERVIILLWMYSIIVFQLGYVNRYVFLINMIILILKTVKLVHWIKCETVQWV